MAASLSGGPFFRDLREQNVMTVQLDQERRSPWVMTGVVALALLSCLLGAAAWHLGWLGDSLVVDAVTMPVPSVAQGGTEPPIAASSVQVVPEGSVAPASALKARPGEVLAHDLMAEYRATRGTVDARYKGKRLKVLGRVASLEQGESGVTLVSLQAEQDLRPLRALMAPATASNAAVAQALTEGRALVFDCLHQGIVMGEPILSDCEASLP